MNTQAQLKALWENFKKAFHSKISTAVFCIIGWIFLVPWVVGLVINIFVIRVTQIPVDEFDKIVSSKHHVALKCTLAVVAGMFMGWIKYGLLPMMYLGYWLTLFFYYPFLYLFTFGKARWEGIIYQISDNQ